MGVASIALILGLQGASAKTLRERLMPLIRKTQHSEGTDSRAGSRSEQAGGVTPAGFLAIF